MASPPEITITEALPDTLPEDFGEWDDEDSPSTQAARLAGTEQGAAGKVAPKAPTSRKAVPAPQSAASSQAGPVRYHSWRSGKAERDEPKQAGKKWPFIVGAGAALAVVLYAAMIPALHHRKASALSEVAAPELAKDVPEPTATATPRPENESSQPPPSTPTSPPPSDQPLAATRNTRDSSDRAPAPNQEHAGPSQARAQIINDHLSAPARIRTVAAPAQQVPPPSSGLAPADVDGSGKNSSIGGVFDREKQPEMQLASPKVVNLPAGAAFSLLIRRTPPVYPQIAKDSRVAGTVVLLAHISKKGTVEDLRVVSGPEMLQQAAVNAVRTWRYRPYRINNQATEIETNIAVTFSLNE
jgi:periplasmic protein TonB